MNINKIRNDFPFFTKNKGYIYFDNACQSLRPQSVMDSMNYYYTNLSACGGRSMHALSAQTTKLFEKVREKVAKFINAKSPHEIIFTRNTTESINLVARSIGLEKGDVVLTTDKEHNSNLVIWQLLEKQIGIKRKIVHSNDDGTFSFENYKEAFDENVKLVSMVFTSNLDGVTIPAKEIVSHAHKKNALVMLDGAQTAPHTKINVSDLDVDFLAFSGHKMLGPTGTGILYGKRKLLEKLNPFLVGGDTVSKTTYSSHEFLDVPERFEAGLQDYAGILGLGAAIDYLLGISIKNIYDHEIKLTTYLQSKIDNISNLHVIGPKDPKLRGGITSFYVDNVDHHKIALTLDSMNKIAVRSGQHCVHSWFDANKIKGSVRVSFYLYNTFEEVDSFINSLKKVINVLL
ncbi:MAG: cysteine desulfurase [Patescibacteria group bacterium]|nr:cysteine desulfurase [Patescibacteria group bacterium]